MRTQSTAYSCIAFGHRWRKFAVFRIAVSRGTIVLGTNMEQILAIGYLRGPKSMESPQDPNGDQNTYKFISY